MPGTLGVELRELTESQHNVRSAMAPPAQKGTKRELAPPGKPLIFCHIGRPSFATFG